MAKSAVSKTLMAGAMGVITFLIMIFIAYVMAEMSVLTAVSDDIKAGAASAAGFFSIIVVIAALNLM